MTAAGECAAVVVAAGRGDRLGAAAGDRPKALVEIAGRPMLELALVGISAPEEVGELVVVHPPGFHNAFAAVVGDGVRLVEGGATRAASVRAGIAAVTSRPAAVAIHDAARPLVPPAVVRRAITAVAGDVIAAAPGLPLADTLKEVGDDGRVLRTAERRGLWAVHTPQVVRADVAATVLASDVGGDPTDDLTLVEAAVAEGRVAGRVVLVRGDPRDLKITWPEDLHVAAALVATGPSAGNIGR